MGKECLRRKMVDKIISGGQTGADQGGLEAGKALGITTGGTAPYNWITEKGPARELLQSYGLVAGPHDPRIYPYRTRRNVYDSDATLIFGVSTEPGTRLTIRFCRQYDKPYKIVTRSELDDLQVVAATRFWLDQVEVLNVAGNRESKGPGLQAAVRDFLIKVLI